MALSLRTPGINLSGEAVSKYLEFCEVENHMNDLGSRLYTERTTPEKSRKADKWHVLFSL